MAAIQMADKCEKMTSCIVIMETEIEATVYLLDGHVCTACISLLV